MQNGHPNACGSICSVSPARDKGRPDGERGSFFTKRALSNSCRAVARNNLGTGDGMLFGVGESWQNDSLCFSPPSQRPQLLSWPETQAAKVVRLKEHKRSEE